MSNTTSDFMLSRLAWQVTLAITSLTVISLQIVDLRFHGHMTPEIIALITGYVCLVVYYRFIRQDHGIACMVISVGQLVVVMVMGIMLTYVASTVPLPYRDFELNVIDRWLGFEREAYLDFLGRNDGLRVVLGFAYDSLLPQSIFVLIASAAVRRIDRLQGYVIAFAIAITATALIATFVPAANALIYLDKMPTDVSTLPDGRHSYFPTLEGLRAGTLRIINFNAMDGLISFPSFHTANAILIVWTLWPIRFLRFVLLPLNLLLIASTPLCGAHYVIDIVGGAAVAFVAILVTSCLARSPRGRASRSPVAREPEAISALRTENDRSRATGAQSLQPR
jgi:membrane-associated phospholipid phosphatase